jgi:hypothetical protein
MRPTQTTLGRKWWLAATISVFVSRYLVRSSQGEPRAIADLEELLVEVRDESKSKECGLDMRQNTPDWFMPLPCGSRLIQLPWLGTISAKGAVSS